MNHAFACELRVSRRVSFMCVLVFCSCFLLGVRAHAQLPLVKISADTFRDSRGEHRTEVEPSTYSWENTIVSVFQVARNQVAGGADIGFATSTNGGKTWTQGYVPGLTEFYERGPNLAASDPSVVYNAKYGVWLISSLTIRSEGTGIAVNRSKDGIHWDKAIVVDDSGSDDKNWITCDNSENSPYYGNCYEEWDVPATLVTIFMSTSTDGGLTWGVPTLTADQAEGSWAQPLVQPNGRVVVPYFPFLATMAAFSSTDGGKSWSDSVTIGPVENYAGNSNLRSVGVPMPSAGIDASGKIYVVWPDCSFRQNCSTNDLVMSTSKDGDHWTAVERIPIDPLTSTIDHFIPGLGVDRATAGHTAHLTVIYYYYPDASCDSATCKLYIGFTTSQDGGQSWTHGSKLAGPMGLDWLPNTLSGVMVGDYLSTSYVNGNPFGVFIVAKPPSDGVFNEAAYTTSDPLLAPAEEPRFSSRGENRIPDAKSDHVFTFFDNDELTPPLWMGSED